MTFKVIKPNTIAPIMDFFPFILDPTKAKIAEIINKTKYKKEGGKVTVQTIKNWIRGNNIAPGDYHNDLVCLSKVMDDEFLLDNIDIMGEEFRKIKSLRIAMGLNLKSIMKSIIVEDFSLSTDSLSLEEQTMHNIIKNSVYRVVNVK